MLRRPNPKNIIAGVKNLASREVQRILPTSKGGEQAVLQTYRTDVSSYFTTPSQDGQLLYTAENWVRVKLTLETAGPVAVGTNAQIGPVLSGKGRLLDTGVEYEIYCARGTAVYIVSESVNRVSFTVEPVPWMEQLSGEITATARTIAQAVDKVGNAIVAALAAISSGKSPAPPPRAPDPPAPQLPRALAGRLTRITPPRKIR